MATRQLSVTTTPVQLTDISDGDNYSARCQGANPIRIAAVAGSSSPTLDGQPSWYVEPGTSVVLQGVSGESVWAWTERGEGMLVYDQVQR